MNLTNEQFQHFEDLVREIIFGRWTKVGVVVVATAFWTFYAFAPRRHPLAPTTYGLPLLLVGLVISFCGVVALDSTISAWNTIYLTLAALNFSTFSFAFIYYELGRVGAFSPSAGLTHLDALYFTVTNLTTVGGDFAPHTERTRFFVACQLLLDVLIVLILITLLVSKLSSVKGSTEDETKDTSNTLPEPEWDGLGLS